MTPDPVPEPEREPAPEPDVCVRRRGRRPAGEDTRGLILRAARAEFGRQGYDAVTLRGIARAAGVDARLVHHYFHGKEDIFVTAMDFPLRPSQALPVVLDGDVADLGERVARMFFGIWETPEGQARVVALLGSGLGSEPASRVLREFFTREFLLRAVVGIAAEDAELRATLVAAQMIGIAVLRYLVGVEPLVSASVEDLVEIVAPTLQRYLTEEL
jgi:AcrR family transcriptional regulator